MVALTLSMLLLGLASGVHCVGMCGGLVAAFTGRKVIAVRSVQPAPWQRLVAFNAGRITSYAIAGARAYGLGTLPWLMAGGVALNWLQQKMARAVAGGMVLAFGVYGLAHGTDLRGLLCL